MPPDPLVLAGRRIGVTADRRGKEQADLFLRRGAEVVHGPTMRTIDLSASDELRQVTTQLVDSPPDILVVTTGMGMRMWLEAAAGWGLERGLLAGLADARVVARGAKAAAAIVRAGLVVSWQAPRETVREIVEHLEATVAGARVAVQLFDPDDIAATVRLRAAGADVIGMPVYRWALPDDPGPALALVEDAVAGRLDAVTFTSQPAVRQLFRLAAGAGQEDELRVALNSTVAASCVGPVCAEAARDEGIEEPLWPEPPRLVAMVRQLTDHLTGT
ncbi:MAG: uroporphyrinogen-III synthase [Acidimicrobiales bacterium]